MDGIYEQHDFYYTCDVETAKMYEVDLSEGEKEAGLQFGLVSLDDAIVKNEAAIHTGIYWTERETYVLRLIRDMDRIICP